MSASETCQHNWSEPGLWTVDSRQQDDFRWCIHCGTLHFYGVQHQPANHNATQQLAVAVEALEKLADFGTYWSTADTHVSARNALARIAELGEVAK